MSTAKMCDTPCETCKKEGLPLLLTRYAVHTAATGAPALGGKLGGGPLAAIPLGAHDQYGLRLLRSGYVYVHDEARKLWDEYFVTSDGFLTKLPPRPKTGSRPPPATQFACARNGAAPLAGVITIRNPKHAKNIWIGFSDVEWTDDTLEKHHDAGYRAKHMTQIVVSGGKVAPQPHTAPIEQVEAVVPEFKLAASVIGKHIAPWNPYPFNSRLAQAQDFKAAVKAARPQGGAAIVALHDPVGLAMEIAALMETRKVTFMPEEEDTKPRFAASAIVSMEAAIKGQAELGEIIAAEDLAERAEKGPGAWNPNAALAGIGGDYEEAARWRKSVTPAHLRRVTDQTWRQYTHKPNGQPRFDAAASKSWLDAYNIKFKRFDSESIAPLAKAHAAWMKHRCMIDQMTCSHDEANREDGVAFTDTVGKLLQHTADKQPSYDLYLAWLKNGEFAAENLVMRALAFNQKELVEKIEKAAKEPSVDGRAFPSDGVAGAIAAYIEKMPASANGRLAALLAGLNGPALKYWDDFHAGKVGSKAAAALAGACNRQFVRLPINGNKGQFIQAYVRQLYRLDPKLKANPNQLQKAVAAQVRLLEIHGVPTQAKSKLGWYVLLDREVVAGATSKNLAGQALADEMAKAIRTPQDLQKIDLARATRVRNIATASGPLLAGFLMILNYSKLLQDVEKSMSHEKAEAIAKLRLGSIAIGGFVAEQVGSGLEKLGEARLRNMMGRYGGYVPQALKVLGRFAGFGVGVVLGLWDISKGWDEFKKGESGLATAYFVSGFSGVAVATTMLFVGMGWVVLGPIGWIILALAVLVWLVATLFIETNKDNGLQEWLSRCHFGTGAEKYPDTATHVKEYNLALAK